jgi:hypothetical protein
MNLGVVRLVWQRDPAGYRIEPARRGAEYRGTIFEEDPGGTYIVPCSGRSEPVESDLLQHGLFHKLATMPATPEGVRSFVNSWGLLTKNPEPDISEFYRASASLRNAIDLGNFGNRISSRRGFAALARNAGPNGLGQLDIRVVDGSPPRLFFHARTLIQFCWLELLQFYDGGAKVSRCPECGTLLPMHKVGRPKNKVGRPKSYCSNACRQRAYRIAARKKRS